jgi:hypothetical protein
MDEESQTAIVSTDPVVVLGDGSGEADDMASCLESRLKSAGLSVLSSDTFRSELFPWFETNVRPRYPDELAMMLAKPLVRTKLDELGMPQVVYVTGKTLEGGGEDAIFCGGGPGGAGCLGLAWEDRETSVSAIVWNLSAADMVGSEELVVSGTTVVPAFILPIPFIPPTKTQACGELAERLIHKR